MHVGGWVSVGYDRCVRVLGVQSGKRREREEGKERNEKK